MEDKFTDKDTHVRCTDTIELMAYIGLLFIRAASKKNLMKVKDVFTHKSSPDLFQACMSYRCFYFLGSFVSSDDFKTRKERFLKDKFACFRRIFETLNVRNAMMRIPSMHLSIDETLCPYRGLIGIKTFNPSKPAKYGILYISVSDAELPYTYYTLPYAGRPEEPNEFYVNGTDKKTLFIEQPFKAHKYSW